MRVSAPGKLLLAGAYAVLEGAPALVLAIDRHAVADDARRSEAPTPEILAAMAAKDAPSVDASALRDSGSKLGLGSSAAMLVASLGVLYARAGKDLRAAESRRALFLEARRAHSAAQSGGSGVDVAASVYGGALEYTLAPDGTATVESMRLPAGIVFDVFWCGAPASTSAMRAGIDRFKAKSAEAYRLRIADIGAAARAAIAAARGDDAAAFAAAAREGSVALSVLGRAADVPIVPPAAEPLSLLAEAEGGAFLPSGAGGGDVFVHLGTAQSSTGFRAAATAAGMRRLPMQSDLDGVRLSTLAPGP